MSGVSRGDSEVGQLEGSETVQRQGGGWGGLYAGTRRVEAMSQLGLVDGTVRVEEAGAGMSARGISGPHETFVSREAQGPVKLGGSRLMSCPPWLLGPHFWKTAVGRVEEGGLEALRPGWGAHPPAWPGDTGDSVAFL